jgi:hypothetical protein
MEMKNTDGRIVPRSSVDLSRNTAKKNRALTSGTAVVYVHRERQNGGYWTECERDARVVEVRGKRVVIDVEINSGRRRMAVRPRLVRRRAELDDRREGRHGA